VQAELRAILSETEELTGVLESQLEELRLRGWNATVPGLQQGDRF
jgi:hypothetical protein